MSYWSGKAPEGRSCAPARALPALGPVRLKVGACGVDPPWVPALNLIAVLAGGSAASVLLALAVGRLLAVDRRVAARHLVDLRGAGGDL